MLPREQMFVIFGHFPSDLDAILLCLDSISSICCRPIVVDLLRIVELLRICCTACRGVVVGIRFVANLSWTCKLICCGHNTSTNPQQIELIEYEHNRRVGLRDTQGGGLFDLPRGPARCVDDALVDQIFTA